MQKRGQAATEFLTTYGWVILILLIAVGAVITLVITAFLTRFLGKAGYGEYNIILAYITFFSVLIDFGIGTRQGA